MKTAWKKEVSVVARASRRTVWEWHSDVANWVRLEGDGVESIVLDGPFQSGARGVTRMAGQEPTNWRLAKVEPPRLTVIEMELADASLRFVWRFEELSQERTRLTQRIELDGPGAAAYAPMMEENFGVNMAAGMERIAAEIEKVARRPRP